MPGLCHCKQGLLSSCGPRPFHCDSFSCCDSWTLSLEGWGGEGSGRRVQDGGAVVHPGKGLDYSTSVSRSLIWVLCAAEAKVLSAPSICFAICLLGALLAIALVSRDDLSTVVLASLYLENSKRCIRWKN